MQLPRRKKARSHPHRAEDRAREGRGTPQSSFPVRTPQCSSARRSPSRVHDESERHKLRASPWSFRRCGGVALQRNHEATAPGSPHEPGTRSGPASRPSLKHPYLPPTRPPRQHIGTCTSTLLAGLLLPKAGPAATRNRRGRSAPTAGPCEARMCARCPGRPTGFRDRHTYQWHAELCGGRLSRIPGCS
jgi:hypothetical protein